MRDVLSTLTLVQFLQHHECDSQRKKAHQPYTLTFSNVEVLRCQHRSQDAAAELF